MSACFKLEGSVAVLQNELFRLCVMLYPTLKVNWELVRLMLPYARSEASRSPRACSSCGHLALF